MAGDCGDYGLGRMRLSERREFKHRRARVATFQQMFEKGDDFHYVTDKMAEARNKPGTVNRGAIAERGVGTGEGGILPPPRQPLPQTRYPLESRA
ncbi:hypothetical protein Memar_1193 [Methanoculleus marisnigri JR1]|uniref:Uncharacterized protein n=1 Tax=Methanoculleus marisnigri (strain ATCC 35101 / DSM 1498 / JR1) TaxID=368407 RepID=A3CUS4_METMJ|nr:hypothetical protein Memar_1193 [Methanoculleus marisnigri JR1]